MKHPVFLENLEKNRKAEKDRIYCRHDLAHFMDVARIAYILVLERSLSIPKDIVYATALLHDIGKHQQYQDKIPHEQASAAIAPEILKECGYLSGEIQFIKETILSHREENKENSFFFCFYQADKLSRPCYTCKVQESCNWSIYKKNLQIKY